MKIKEAAAVLIQFRSPERAYGYLTGGGQSAAIAGALGLIFLVGFIPFLFQGLASTAGIEVAFLILLERIILSVAAGVSVYILSYALGERKPLWPAVSSSLLSMGAFMVSIALLTLLSHLLSLSLQFTWSPAEILFGLPRTRLTVFILLFTARLDLASIVTVYLWGRGLSTVWKVDLSIGQRMVWTVYLFGILLITLSVFIAAPGVEGAS